MSIQWPCTTYAEDVALAVHRILSAAGPDALTMRGIARAARVSPGTLANRFESREQLLASTAGVVGRLLAGDLAGRNLGRPPLDQLLGMVARDEYERADLKVWLDLVALGRTSEAIGERVQVAEAWLRALVARACEDSSARSWLALQGAWAYQLSPGRDMDVAGTQALLAALLPPDLTS